MKGLQPLFLGIFGIFAFSWLGMMVVPNLQIGGLNPQSDEEGTDIYPMPPSGMVARGARVYAANGCVYCHSQQVRPDYGGSDLDRKWGERRSAPRDYIFQPIVFLGKMRAGPDLANVGHRPKFAEAGAATPPPAQAGSPPPNAPATATAPAAGTSPVPSPAAVAANPAPAASPTAAASPAIAAAGAPSLVADVKALTDTANPPPYTAAWHHRHLYNPRSMAEDSNMPAYRFLYKKHRISGLGSFDAINFGGKKEEEPENGWEIVPSYDAKCLVAYLMSLDQSHPLKEAKSPIAMAPAPGKEAPK